MLRTWNESPKVHFANCECPKRVVKTLWALAVCAGLGALCGVVCGFVIGASVGLLFGLYGALIGSGVGAVLGAIAGSYSGLIGAAWGGENGWMMGGFLGSALVGLWLFFVTGAIGALASSSAYDFVLKSSDHNPLCRWILETYNNSDLGEWRTRKLWLALVMAFYALSILFSFKLLSQ